MDVAGVVALVTGGASGLGAGVAHALAARGADVVVLDLPEAEARVRDAGLGFFAADVRDGQQVATAIETASARGQLRVVVNCAGIATAGRVLRRGVPHDLGDFARVLEINVVGTFNVLRLAAAAMANLEYVGDSRGVIVNTASVAAYDGQVGQVAYATSKAAIAGMTLPVARDLGEHGIRCVAVAPGIFDTPLLADLPKAALDAVEASIPQPSRLGRPEEFAALVLHIVQNEMLNGEVVRLDGAVRMAPR